MRSRPNDDGFANCPRLETLRELARNANARIYLGFDKTGLKVEDRDG